MKKLLNLQLMADGAEGVATSEGTSTGTAESGVAPTAPKAKGKANPLANVQYGKAPEQAEPEAPEEQPKEDEEVSFESLIGKDGKYKAEFDAKVQSIVQNRLKNSKANEETLSKLGPVFELLGSKYGIDASDPTKIDFDNLVKTITEDDSYYEQEALEKGIPVETLKELKRMQRENAEARKAIEEAERRQQNEQIFAKWNQEATELKQIYPSFDFDAEMQNPTFGRLVSSGLLPMRDVFELVHKNELQPAAMAMVADMAKKQVVNNITANAARPVENGLSGTSASTFKSDPRNLTRADLAEIRRRVQRGEKISF